MPEETDWEAEYRFWREAKETKPEETQKLRLILEAAYGKACEAYDSGDYDRAARLCERLVSLPEVLDIFHQHGCYAMMSKIKPMFAERAEKISKFVENKFGNDFPMVVDIMRHTFFRSSSRETIEKWDEAKGVKKENSLVSAMKEMDIAELVDEEAKMVALLEGLTVE